LRAGLLGGGVEGVWGWRGRVDADEMKSPVEFSTDVGNCCGINF